MRLRVVSWNVHGCVGTDGRFDPHRTAEALRSLAPDVALLQEVGDLRGVHPPIDQATTLADELGYSTALGITVKAGPYGYGNATLTRGVVLSSSSIDLSVWGREPRVALQALVGFGAFELTILNVHLGLGPGERRRQLRRLLPVLPRSGEAPVVMGGDFNDFPPGPVSHTLRDVLVDAGTLMRRSRTWPSARPLLRLDRVYVGPALPIVHAMVPRDGPFRLASDHLPVVVDVEAPP